MIETILWGIAVIAPGALVAIILHEVAHGWAAHALGDPTAKLHGRLSLNPVRHVDPFGTIALPLMLFAFQMLTIGRIEFLFGWAKPVPVDTRYFRRPRQDMALVAAAGPAMNLALAFAIAAMGHLVDLPPRPVGIFLAEMIIFAVQINLLLMLFNLIPVPPLDGGRILVGLLPLGPARALARLEHAGIFIVLFGLFVVPAILRQAGIPSDPIGQWLLPPLFWLRRLVFTAVGL
ncbi:site-2 protease family protein [Elioraea sp. Yellowstone]|uniref:site-2 protease family protein n=1 Tax=Elioraea sp. Yellowstone TaxID=2592070 RepID=UPI00114FED4E|nr:site-2 protease family protein [Elioraea sp. Yellowstone]TQF77070.1 site-2 protease family protein [Elioraea sp. Yellowstone]